MSLTWRDVAGGVRAPDLSGSVDAITRGLTGLGTTVKNLIGAPEAREQAELVRQSKLLGAQLEFGAINAKAMDALGDDVKASKKEADQLEFASSQSKLEQLARDTALKGGSIDDLFKSEAYLSLGEGARAYGQAHLSDAFFQGDQARVQRAEQAQNNRIQMAQLGLAQAAAKRAEIESGLRIKALNKAITDANGGLTSKDPETKLVLGDFTSRVARNMFEAGGGFYADKDIGKLAEQAGIEDTSMATGIFNRVNAERKAQGKALLPEGVLKSLIAGASGKNEWFGGAWTTFDETSFEGDLGIRADMYDAASMEDVLLKDLRHRANRGQTFSSAALDAEFERLKPQPKPVSVKPAATASQIPTPDFSTWRGGARGY